jgi:2-polyprenyl-3-methyl-5-hydroxy-6-metoxy-1,4-benzoquinol methylase
MDEAKAEAFAGELLNTLNAGYISLMIASGYNLGLLDRMAELPPSTSDEIAAAAGLNERYVREWLGAMATGKIVDYDAATRKFVFPEEHAAFLTRAAGLNNLATMAAMLPEFGKVADKVNDCFRRGGGVPYSEFDTFQTLMRDLSAQTLDATLLDVALPFVPDVTEKLKAGIEVADIGCGAGHAINLMAQAFPNSRFVGYDFSEEGIGLARAEVTSMGLTNASFEVRDAAKLGISERFDFITIFDAVHDQAFPDQMLKSVYDALKPGADLLCVDIQASSDLAENLDNPLAPMLYTISTMHCMTVSLAYGGVGLGTVWGEQKALEMFNAAGFEDIKVNHLEGDPFNNYYVMRK